MDKPVEEILGLMNKVQSQDDLQIINKALASRWRALGNGVAQSAMLSKQLSTGDFVSFTAKGRKIYGTVKSLNQKTVSVEPNGGVLYGPCWRVAPQLLTKEDKLPAPPPPPVHRHNLIDMPPVPQWDPKKMNTES